MIGPNPGNTDATHVPRRCRPRPWLRPAAHTPEFRFRFDAALSAALLMASVLDEDQACKSDQRSRSLLGKSERADAGVCASNATMKACPLSPHGAPRSTR